MFELLAPGHLLVLLVVGLCLFGPDRLPQVVAETVQVVAQLRRLAADTGQELRSGLGSELSDVDLRSLHPRTLVQSVLSEDPAGAVGQADAAAPPPPGGSSLEVPSAPRGAGTPAPGGGLPPVDVEAT